MEILNGSIIELNTGKFNLKEEYSPARTDQA